MKTEERIEAIKKRLAAATPGPWFPCLGSGDIFLTAIKADAPDNKSYMVADTSPSYALQWAGPLDHRGNLNFLLGTIEDIPFLLEVIESLQANQRTNVDEYFDELRKDKRFCIEADALRTKRWKQEFERACRLEAKLEVTKKALELACGKQRPSHWLKKAAQVQA